jgi:hypothetical protein
MGTKATFVLAMAALAATAAEGADLSYEPGPDVSYAEPNEITEQVLRWDNGTLGSVLAQFVAGTWIGNGFDCSTIAMSNIKCFRIRSSGEWPNSRWDGFNVGVFDFRNGVPGARIWGPRFVTGAGRGYPWCEFGVNWTLPKGIRKFVAAMGQRYNYPDVDPYCLDTGPALRRIWTYSQGIWRPYESESNLMFRVVLQGDIGVEPTSIGRVKALYN